MSSFSIPLQGSDYAGNTFGQLAELGVKIINLEAYRADEKGVVEKFFDIIQGFFKPHLKGAGVVAGEYLERGSYFTDYKEKSCLTLREFETVLLRCIVHYNSRHIISNFPFTEEMARMGVKPYSNCIWEYGIENLRGCNVLADITKEQAVLTLLPRTSGSFSRSGLKVNGLRYFCDGFFERCLKGGKATVAYDEERCFVRMAAGGREVYTVRADRVPLPGEGPGGGAGHEGKAESAHKKRAALQHSV